MYTVNTLIVSSKVSLICCYVFLMVMDGGRYNVISENLTCKYFLLKKLCTIDKLVIKRKKELHSP